MKYFFGTRKFSNLLKIMDSCIAWLLRLVCILREMSLPPLLLLESATAENIMQYNNSIFELYIYDLLSVI